MRTTPLLYIATSILLLFTRQTAPRTPDTIFFGGNIVTVDPAFSIQQAFAIRGEEFLAVGTDARILPLAGPQTRKIDLRGSTLIPGLIDDHDHVYAAAMAARGRVTSPMSEREEDELILEMQKAKNAEGLTSVRDLNIGPEAVRAYQRLWRAGKLTLWDCGSKVSATLSRALKVPALRPRPGITGCAWILRPRRPLPFRGLHFSSQFFC
jgi:hypothetical protein